MIFVACILMFLLTLIFRANYVIKKEYVFFQDLHLVTSRKFTKLYFAVSTKCFVELLQEFEKDENFEVRLTEVEGNCLFTSYPLITYSNEIKTFPWLSIYCMFV
jgi:hypothetical protein